MKKQSNRVGSQSREHWAGIADAARQLAVAASWEQSMGLAARGEASNNVKLHPGWDAAFKRARSS